MENTYRLLSGVVFAIVAVSLIALRSDEEPPPTDSWFQKAVLESSKPVVVKFGAEWCGPCRSMDEAIKELRPKLSSKLGFFIVNIDQKPELFRHYGSGSGIPQVMIFDKGKVVASQRGFGSIEQLESWIDQNI
ncbi:MAG: thiol reductase thioredoxin [Fuerstia sp.]|nr:thiol reductase thioredoxin [Fuerstiella sp.]